MALDHQSAGENSMYLLKLFFGLFIAGYFFWYFGDGPAKWEAKMQSINKESIQQNIGGKGVFKVGQER